MNLSGPFRVVLRLVSVLAAIPISLHTAGAGNLPLSAIVVDANSGTVLYTAGPDELRHPASLTKIMTLYLLFERMEAGKLKVDSQLPVSEHASVQAPSKLGLRPGQTIAVEDAIRAMVTKSANDVAVVVAEAIGGSEGEFANLMTKKAHALGMSHTVYRNASGLPNDEQVTTAREQALSAAPSRNGSHANTAISPRRPSPITAKRCATTTTCSAMSRASTASKLATPRHPDSTW